jgi:uncharacterized protein YlxP (DUF503 family)
MVTTANVYVAVARLELFVPEARSLKEKRSQTRSLIDRIRSRHQVLVVEIEHQDLHQRAAFAVCAVSTDPVDLEARMQRVESTIDRHWSGHVLEWNVELIQS